MRTDINHFHMLFASTYYPHTKMRIAVLGYANVVINHIRIPYIYNKFTKSTSFWYLIPK